MSSHALLGQKFHFGASAGLIASQVDGDELSGFTKLGYQASLLSGYSFNETSWMLVELQYSTYGSKKGVNNNSGGATLNPNGDLRGRVAEIDLSSVNILAAYCIRFGDSWDGEKKVRFLVGPKLHRVINSDSRVIPDEAVRAFFVAGHIGFSYIASPSVMLDITYTHSLTNILSEPVEQIDNLEPYYLNFGVSYYLNKRQ